MTAAERLYDKLDEARKATLEGKLPKPEWLAVVEAFLASLSKERRAAAVDAGAAEIYEAYPKKVGRDDALKAITAALKKHPKEYLLDKTAQFAAAVASWPSSYRYKLDGRDTCPHPATWFNQGRYADDPGEWRRAGSRSAPGGRPAPAGPTPAQEEQAARDADAMRQKYLAMKEPKKGTLEHSFWLEARTASAVAGVTEAVTAPVRRIEQEERLRNA